MKTRSLLVLCIIIMHLSLIAQVKIGNNPTVINSASLLELETTNQGFVLPRISIADVSASSPLVSGLLTGTVVYNTNSTTTGGSGAGIYLWNGTKWLAISTGASVSSTSWLLTGNSGTTSSNFLGTTDAQNLRFKVNNQLSGLIDYSANSITTFGYLAGLNNGTTTGTTAFGWKALTANTTGQNNTAVGDNTMASNTTGGSNTALGFNALAASITGGANTALGYGTLIANTASFNTGGGYLSLNTNTSGAGNTAFGSNALSTNTTGSNNTAIGYNADVSAAGLTNATAIGYNAKAGASNTVILGSGDAKVGINTSTPAQKLEIAGIGGTIRVAGLASGGSFNNAVTTAASNLLYTSNVTGDMYALPTNNSAILVTSSTGIPSWSTTALSSNAWLLTGNTGTSYATNFLGTKDNVSLRFRTNNIERMIVDSLGKVGIGISNPSYALSVLSATNPLYLSGVQATATFTTDSVITINAGVVKKAPYSSLTGNFWSLTGNSGTSYATNFLGTTDNVSLRFRTNNTERMIIDSLGSVGIGSSAFNATNREKLLVDAGTTTSHTIANLTGSIDDYFQINSQNKSSGVNASTDYVATSNDGSDSTYYADFGINSSTYAPGVENFGGPHDAYLYASSRNLLIGAASSNADIIFLLGGGKIRNNSALRLNGADGNIIVGKGESSTTPIGNIIRGPDALTSGTNIAGGSLTLQGGSATGTAAGGNLNIYGGTTVSGTPGAVNINASLNNATNINTGTSTGTVTLGNSLNNINLPKLSATSVVLTDASKNLTSSTPSNNTYLYYNGTNFTWATAASSLASLTNGSGIGSLNYNGSSAATVSLENGTAAGQVYVTGGLSFTPSLVTISGDATINSTGALSLATVNSNVGTFNNITVNAKGLVTAASNISYATLGSFSATAPLTYNNTTGVFGINKATALADGYLSSTDWNTFNNKIGSITLNAPSIFSTPVNFSVASGAATGTLSLGTQTANTVFAGPLSGLAAAPTFRALVAADIPSLAGSYIQNQSTLQASSNFNISGNGTIGTNLSVTGTSTLTGAVTSSGSITNTGILTSSGGAVNVNASSNNATNINTGTSTGTLTLGNALNNINLPKLSATSVVLTDASKNVTSSTPSNNTYLYYNGTNFTWASAASSLASLTNGSGIASLNYNGSSAATVSLANGTATGQVYVTAGLSFTPSLVTMSGDATVSSTGALSLSTVNSNVGTFNNVTVNAKGLVTSASNVAYSTLGSFSATAPLSYNSATGVFSISQAGTLANGYLSSTDWNTFNNKVGSITLNTPSSVFGSPINFSVTSGAASGTLSLNTQTANTVFAGPSGGVAAAPTFRALTAADIPSLGGTYIQNQTTLQASSNFNISGNGTIGTNLAVTGTSTLTGAVTSNGGITNTGILTSAGGAVNINASSNNATNINTGTSTSNVTIGNSSNNILLPKFSTTGGLFFTGAATGQIANTATDMTWDDVNNRLGIGITTPSTALHVNGILSLGKSTTTTGGLSFYNSTNINTVSINSGITSTAYTLTLPTAAPTANGQTLVSTIGGTLSWATVSGVGSSSAWQLTGNAGTNSAINFLGTTDAQALVLKSQNRQMANFDGNLYNVGIGNGAINSGDHNVAIGYSAISSNQYALSLGYNSIASGVGSIAIGNGASSTTASSSQSVAIGYSALCSAAQGLALGYQATASGQYATALGYSSLSSGTQSQAIGYSSLSSGQHSTAIGYSSQSTGLHSLAVGSGAQASGVQSAAIGYGATTSQANAIVLGNSSANVGIGTSLPNTSAKLDVDGNFKLGDFGTVQKNIVSTSSATNTSVPPQFNAVVILGITLLQLNSGSNYSDITVTLPSTLSSTQASVSVSPNFDMPTGVYIAFARVISTTQVKIRLMNSGTSSQTVLGSLYVTVTEF